MSTRLLNLPSIPKWWRNQYTFVMIVLISIALHAWSIWQLPIDFDEPVYIQAGKDYSRFIAQGSIGGILEYSENREHPPLVKLLYSIPFLFSTRYPGDSFYLYATRCISAIFGVLAVAVIARKNLWAGFLFALHSMTLKYTSQAYLEALPMLMAILTLILLDKASIQRRKYLWLSAICFGITGAAKYPYLAIILVILFIFLQKKEFTIGEVILYFGLSLIVFFILNPNLWRNPIEELGSIINFHTAYSQSAHVQVSNYQWYQPLNFISTSVQWHPQVFFFFTSDEFTFWIAMVGIYFEVKEKKWEAVWFLTGLFVLLMWPTKWPQYTLLITPALALIAGNTISRAIRWIRPKEDYWNYLEEMLPQPPKITWVILVLFVSALLIGKLAFEFQLAYARRGWEAISSLNSPLLNDFVNDINVSKPGEVVIANDTGINIWQISAEGLIGEDQPVEFDQSNSNLPADEIRNIAYDKNSDTFWFGSSVGVSELTNDFVNFGASEIGCFDCTVNDIYFDQDSKLWIATNEGIYHYDGVSWENYTAMHPGIESNGILSLYIQKDSENQFTLWAGTFNGISAVHLNENQWTNFAWSDDFFGWGGVLQIDETTDHQIVACTSGGGIAIGTLQEWRFYKNSNSPLKSNTALSFAEAPNGDFWFGMGHATEPGGYLMRLDQKGEWQQFVNNNSGFNEGEPLQLAFDSAGRLWIATNGDGIQTFLAPK